VELNNSEQNRTEEIRLEVASSIEIVPLVIYWHSGPIWSGR